MRASLSASAVCSFLVLCGGCAAIAGLGDFAPADDGAAGDGADGGDASVGPGSTTAGGGIAGAGGFGGQGTGGDGSGAGGSGGAGPGSSSSGGSGGGTCVDLSQNGNETDVDCGGPDCDPCEVGEGCAIGSDCETSKCEGTTCECGTHLILSELRTRGTSQGSDEFVEIYNPTSAPVTLPAGEWRIEARSATAMVYGDRWVSAGETIPPYGHLLVVGSAYSGATLEDATLLTGISDAGSVRLKQGTTVIDALCFCHDSLTCTQVNAAGFSCEQTPATNPNGAGINQDASMERKAGGALGNCFDSDVNSVDFATSMPSQPQSTASPSTP